MHRSFFLFSRSFLRWKCKLEAERAIGRKQPSLDRFIWPKRVRQRSLVSSFIFLPTASLSARLVDLTYISQLPQSRAPTGNCEPEGFRGKRLLRGSCWSVAFTREGSY